VDGAEQEAPYLSVQDLEAPGEIKKVAIVASLQLALDQPKERTCICQTNV
jgi:hypothetical protein